MNPNLAQSLDPKLKEVYDRVMGSAPANPPLQHVPVEGMPNSTPTPTPIPTPAVEEVPSPTPPSAEPEMVNINTSAAPAAKPASSKKISPVIFVVAGVGFFLVYTIVWLKIFKIL